MVSVKFDSRPDTADPGEIGRGTTYYMYYRPTGTVFNIEGDSRRIPEVLHGVCRIVSLKTPLDNFGVLCGWSEVAIRGAVRIHQFNN